MIQRYRIAVNTPSSHADAVRTAMAEAGAGVIGNYTHCSFSYKGIGRCMPGEGANPTIGTIGQLEEIEEERIETFCNAEDLDTVLAAINAAHPYEEPATDVIPLAN